MDIYINAYSQLQSDRPIGMDIGPIPWSSVIKWCQLHDICDINDIETTFRYIKALEQVDRKLEERKSSKK